MTSLAIYTEDNKLLPPVQEVLAGVLTQYPSIDHVEQWSVTTDPMMPVLALGHPPVATPIKMVKTLSQKQILSNPAAITELSAGINLLTAPPKFKDVAIKILDENSLAEAQRIKFGPVLVVDIETGGDIKTFKPAEMWLLSLAVYDGGDTAYVWTEEALKSNFIIRFIERLLRKKKLIAHNMKFDFQTLGAHFGKPIFGHLDTLLLHHSINPGAKEHGLKELCRKYLGAPDWDAGTKDYAKGKYRIKDGAIVKGGLPDYAYPPALLAKYISRGYGLPIGYESIPREILYPYNGWDVIWTWRLFEYFKPAVAGDARLAKLALMEYEFGNFFQRVEAPGFAVDVDYLNQLGETLGSERDAVLIQLRKYVGKPEFNPNSPPQVKAQMLEYGYGMDSTSEDKLDDLRKQKSTAPEVVKFIDLLLDARGYTKMIGTYVDGILKRTHEGRVHSTFKVQGTNTGRTSSANPNVQNIPRDEEGQLSLRRIFISSNPKTRSLIECDYSQAELRVMACLSNDEYLISLFQPGMPDFFDSLMPVTYPRLDLPTLDPSTRKNYRANLKGVIYGLSYGRKEFAIAKALDMPVREAKGIITNYFRAAPQFYDWRQWVEAMALSEEDTLVSPFGRYYQSEVVTSINKQNIINAGLAFLPQSTASDLCLQAALRVQPQLEEFDAYIVATIHDAIMIDGPDQHKRAIADMVQFEMQESGRRIFGDVLPFATDATFGKSWEGM